MSSWPPSPARLAEQATLALRIALERCSTHALAVIVDPALADPWEALSAYLPAASVRMRIPVNHPDITCASRPYLIVIADERQHERFVSKTLELGAQECLEGACNVRSGRAICGWLPVDAATLANPGTLLRGLAACATIVRTGERPLYFRYFDPRVTAQLENILSPTQRRSLIHPALGWLFLHPTGRMHALELGAEASSGPEPFSMTREQFSALHRVPWLQQLRFQSRNWGLAVPPEDLQLDVALAQAQRVGLTAQEDCLVHATCSFLIGPRFDGHAYVSAFLAEAREKPGHFASGMARLTEGQLMEIRDSANETSVRQGSRHDR
ncbi:TPA: hypothetical protein UMT89_000450 [Stenotrophomonas maltophilia]|nr:hypothetical protein [Stenotrophomonas maltophilia]